MSLAILTQHLFRDFPPLLRGGEEEREINAYYMAHFKETEQNKKTQGDCLWKMNKRIPKTKKYMKLYATLKTNSRFIKFCLFGGYMGCNRNMRWFTVPSLCSQVLNKHSLPSGKWLSPNTSEQSYIFISLHFVSMSQTYTKFCVYAHCRIHWGNCTCSEMFLLITNIWWTWRPSAQKAIVLKLIVDHSPSNTFQFSLLCTNTNA